MSVISISDGMNIIRHETITDMHMKTNTAFCCHTIKNPNKDKGVFLVGAENKHIIKYNFDFRDYTFEKEGSYLGHSNSVRSVTTNADVTRMLSTCEDHSLRVWNYDNYEPMLILTGHKDNVVIINQTLISFLEWRQIRERSCDCKQLLGLEGHDLEHMIVLICLILI